MLVFKNNIYEPYHSSYGNLVLTPNEDYNQRFDPRHLIQVALKEEKIVMSFIERQPRQYWQEDLLQFYPYSVKTNSLIHAKKICEILEVGLENSLLWQHMNSLSLFFSL